MKNINHQSQAHDKPKTLIVGNLTGVLEDPALPEKLDFSVCTNISDAIASASPQKYDRILVSMQDFSRKRKEELSTLRKLYDPAMIILLARMLDEPMAIKLTCSLNGTKAIADDYFVCPADTDLIEDKLPAKSQSLLESSLQATIKNKDGRIAELEKLVIEDDLTGLKNRRYVREFLKQLIVRAKKDDMKITLFVFDIDNFKHYNDMYGHAVGDTVLKQAGLMMCRCCREHDVVGRIGGDEFAVIFWDCPADSDADKIVQKPTAERRKTSEHPQEALFICERFRKEISSTEFSLLGPDGKGELAISGGLASFPKDGSKVEELFKQADLAMLEAKRSGKNRIYLVGTPK
jgi:diguanylate cyclase (GGDEF)-like protein